MIANVHQPERVRDRLAGQHVLITGSTGFLAKAFVEKLLRSVDTIGGLHLLVRPRSDNTSVSQRVQREVLRTKAFDRLRAALGDRFKDLCAAKVHAVSGDLTKERFGLSEPDYAQLTHTITLVVNSAATVTFDERLDHAIELNSLGPQRLLQFAKDCGDIPFLHVSTCYVCGARRGTVVEDITAPEVARESLPRKADGSFDLDSLVAQMQAETREISATLGAETEDCRRELIDAGMRWSRRYGWHDTYTFTKWIGEQLLLRSRGEVPLTIFRPAIIEGSFDEPAPGWIDGLRMADPMIVAYGRGKLLEFPGLSSALLDFIPVDFVANGMIAALPARGEGMAVYHCASSDRKPLEVGTFTGLMLEAFERRPMSGDDGHPPHLKPLAMINQEEFVRRWQARRARARRVHRVLTALGVEGKKLRRMTAALRQIDQLLYFGKIYAPYTHMDCRFAIDNLRALQERMPPEDRREFPFDPAAIDWTDYIVNRHIPGLRAFVLGSSTEPAPRVLGVADWQKLHAAPAQALRPTTNLFAMFERAAKRFGDKPVLQICRNGRWIRYTYDDVLRTTGTINKRFAERGLVVGDRVAICGENGPEWGLVYLALMRAGLTAVPLDPQLPAAEAWAAARYAGAKLMCAGRTTKDALLKQRSFDDPEMVLMAEPLVPPPGASRDIAPEPAQVDESAIASILFTSGTTVAAKAVPLTHGNLMANAAALVETHPVYPSDELLSVLPLYHAFEFTGGFMTPICCGATVTYVDQLKGSEIAAMMQATGTTVMLVVPRLLKMFHDSIENNLASSGMLPRAAFRALGVVSNLTGGKFARRLFRSVHRKFGGRLRMIVCGGSRLDPELFRYFQRLGFTVYEGYGLTETSPVLTVHRAGDARAGSVGPALPNVELEIRNTNLEGIGEVWVRGPSVMSGYLSNEEATREVVVDGWLRTGDLGRQSEDGHVFLTGRSKDLIVTSAGKNVYPDEVEVRYRDLPYVKELCVFGLPADDGLGDTVHAVIVLDEAAAPHLDRSSMEREVREAAAERGESLPAHQRISTLHFWTVDLPKTSTLKAKRGAIRDRVLTERRAFRGERPIERQAPLAGSDGAINKAALEAVRQILSRQTKQPEDAIHPNSHLLLDLGIDSIGRIDVLGAIESKFGMRVDDAAASKVARVSDLLRLVGERKPGAGTAARRDTWRAYVEAADPVPKSNGHLSPAAVPVRWLARGTVGALMHSYVRVRVHGRENIPEKGAFILAPNHSSHLDGPAVLTAVGGKRRVWIAGAEDYFFNNGLKRFVFGKLFDTIPFDRQADGIAGLRRCGDALSRGDGLLMFPEGTRSLNGRVHEFKVGVAVLAMQRGVPIVPVYIHRAYALWRKGSHFVRPGVIEVSFGKPVYPPEVDDKAGRHAAFFALARQVEDAVRQLAGSGT